MDMSSKSRLLKLCFKATISPPVEKMDFYEPFQVVACLVNMERHPWFGLRKPFQHSCKVIKLITFYLLYMIRMFKFYSIPLIFLGVKVSSYPKLLDFNSFLIILIKINVTFILSRKLDMEPRLDHRQAFIYFIPILSNSLRDSVFSSLIILDWSLSGYTGYGGVCF